MAKARELFSVCVLTTKGESGQLTYRVRRLPLEVAQGLVGKAFGEAAPFFQSRGSSIKGPDPVRVCHTRRGMEVQVGLWCGGSSRRIKVFELCHPKCSFNSDQQNSDQIQPQEAPSADRRKGGDRLPGRGRRRTTQPSQPRMN